MSKQDKKREAKQKQWRAERDQLRSFQSKAPQLKAIARSRGFSLPFFDALDSYEAEFNKIVSEAMATFSQLIGVFEVDSRDAALLDQEGHGIGRDWEQVYYSISDPAAATYNDPGLTGNIHGNTATFRQPGGRIRTRISVGRAVPGLVHHRDYKYDFKLVALLHELGHVHDIEKPINLHCADGTADIIEAEVYANLYALDQCNRRGLFISADTLEDALQTCLGGADYRAGFARSLANSILGLKGPDSIVIGLCGEWGSGKTSVLNFLEAGLADAPPSARPLVLRFNPWWFSGQDRLLQAFLQQLGAALDRAEKDKTLKKVSAKLNKLSVVLKPAALFPVIGEFAKLAQEAAASGADAAKHFADAMGADLNQIRKEIDDRLRQAPNRVVIVMGDIDRLAAGEVAQLFATLKAVADFPNTVYVLAYDERVVKRAVRTTMGVSGKAYLEKIVQLRIDLPSPDKMALHQLFAVRLPASPGRGVLAGRSRGRVSDHLCAGGRPHRHDSPRVVRRHHRRSGRPEGGRGVPQGLGAKGRGCRTPGNRGSCSSAVPEGRLGARR